jgi:hypothetical protein
MRRQEGKMSEWQSLYQAAVLETDWSKMEERILIADFAIAERLHQFSTDHGGTPEENQAIADAVNGLKILRRQVAEHKIKGGLKRA